MAATMLAGWAAFNLVVVPWRAPTAATRVALQFVEGKLPVGEPVYTTRTFPVTAEGYYNLQFHLAGDVRAADVVRLKALGIAFSPSSQLRNPRAIQLGGFPANNHPTIMGGRLYLGLPIVTLGVEFELPPPGR